MIVVLECSGEGAKKFLQGQLTCDVNQLIHHQPQLSACCNLQGRVIFTADILKIDDETFLLIIPAIMQKIVFSHLEKYAKFSKCSLKTIEKTDGCFAHLDGQEVKSRILNGIPTIYPETSEQFIPQRLNLDLIPGAMSFKKGCYLGQEIIARLHFKGQLKHRMYLGRMSFDCSLIEPKIGKNITDENQQNTGQMLDFTHDDKNLIFLFVNSIENKMPHIYHQPIEFLPLPYSFKG